MPITIKPAETNEDFDAIAQISIDAWQATALDGMPPHALMAIADNKGTVLIAYDGETAVGFCFSIFSFFGEQISDPNIHFYHYSHQAGVMPSHRGQQLGEKLKWAQRDAVLQQGITHIRWTFDPLQTLNAKLNIGKLGAVCDTYIRNRYGELDDDLNRGLPTDRFEVDWWIDSEWVQAHQDKTYRAPEPSERAHYTPINSFSVQKGILYPKAVHLNDWSEQLIMTIPRNFVELRRINLPLALEWRYHARELFEAAFARGYTAVNLLEENGRCHYLFEKNWQRH